MNSAELHLALNHLPVLGIIFGLLVGLYGWLRRKPDVLKVALVTFVVAGALTAVVMATGEEAEDVVEGQPGVTHAVIEPHEEAAEGASIAAYVLGVAALVVLVGFRKREAPRALTGGVLLLALVVGGWMAYVAGLGGRINHPELRGATAIEAPAYEEADD